MLVPAAALALALLGAPDDDLDDERPRYEDSSRHFELAAWGGNSWLVGQGQSGSGPFGGAELGWAFETTTLGLLYERHGYRESGVPVSADVGVLRVEQRFESYRGLEGMLTLGLGAGQVRSRQTPDGRVATVWEFWYQLALGVKLGSGPVFVKGEFGFERQSWVRVGAALGVAF